MIVWSGWGILALVFAMLGAMVGTLAGLAVGVVAEPTNFGTALGLAAAAVAIWFVGRRLNRPKPGFDERTGERVMLGGRHKLFFVPMQYWGPAVGALAVLAGVLAI
ncbi:hypothetical protein DI005_07045 [Prauserella sp. PE36]|uniref:Uncharacterized protein n=1 Tax=Prauserella endophytica TaxID=1592324 RepID=A0ABY2S8Q7_9PSEU|nr:hypothetical protein BAY59_19930 [Prauserella coralliicola]RBM22383.1 hypothetical protein DI005_07045 [Prauserella sp. PE36]TKG72002.1 hypothetical protein FCN18_09465 [Prauserella endophytica]